MINTPYVKQYNSKGVLTNPIEENYLNHNPNRAQRRSKPPRFLNNKKGIQLSISRGLDGKVKKWYKKVQHIGNKTIIHYADTY